MKISGIIILVVLLCYMILGGRYFLRLEGKERLSRKEKIIGYGAMWTILTFPIWCYICFIMIGL